MTNIENTAASEPNPAPTPAPTAPAAPAATAPTAPPPVRRGFPGIAVAGIAVGGVVAAGLLFGGGVAVGVMLPFGSPGVSSSSTGGLPGRDSTGHGARPTLPDGGSPRRLPGSPNTDDTQTRDDSEQG